MYIYKNNLLEETLLVKETFLHKSVPITTQLESLYQNETKQLQNFLQKVNCLNNAAFSSSHDQILSFDSALVHASAFGFEVPAQKSAAIIMTNCRDQKYLEITIMPLVYWTQSKLTGLRSQRVSFYSSMLFSNHKSA